MEQQNKINIELNEEFGLPDIDDFESDVLPLSTKIDINEVQKYEDEDGSSDKGSTSCSSATEENESVKHFKNYHPINLKFKNIKLRSVSRSLCLELSHSSSWKLSDEYELIKNIGFGTYAEVWLAKRKVDKLETAIKIAKGDTSIELLKNEAEILKGLDSKFFPKFFDYQVDSLNNRSWLMMEYIEGEDLCHFYEHSDVWKNLYHYLESLILAVNELHSIRLAHRDLKPENVLINSKGDLKIIDFNISKKWKECDKKLKPSSPFSATSIDRNLFDYIEPWDSQFSGVFLSQITTQLYAAPEIRNKLWYSESVDIWGIGILIIWLFRKEWTPPKDQRKFFWNFFEWIIILINQLKAFILNLSLFTDF